MSSFGASLAGFASGLNSGLSTGQRLSQLVEDDKIAKVRAQGIAEAQAMQAAAAPKVQDNGDMQNLTSNPQASSDPNAQPAPVNTDLNALINAQQAQRDGGPQGLPVAPPAQPQDTSQLSSTPLASAAPGAAAPADAPPAAFANGLPQVPRKRFNVDGQEFDDRSQADAAAKAKTPKLEDFYAKALVPRMKDALIAQGKIEEADRWEQYASSEKSRKYGETWLNAVKLAHQEDFDGAASELMKLHPHFADGYDLLSAEKAKGDDGTTGFNMKIRAPDGSVKEMYQNSRTLVEMGAPQLSPIEAFKKMDAKQTAADTLQAKVKFDEQNDKRTLDRQLAVEVARDTAAEKRAKINNDGKAERQATGIDANKDRDEAKAAARLEQITKAAELRAKDYADRIKAGSQYRKGASPEDTRRMVWIKLKDDRAFNKLSEDEQNATVEKTVDQLHNGFVKKGAAPAKSGTTVPNPVADPKAQGIQTAAAPSLSVQPPNPAAPAGKKAVPVFNPATGKVETVYR